MSQTPGPPPGPQEPPVPPVPPVPPQGGYPGYGYGYPPPQPVPQTSTDAVIALVTALLSFAVCPLILAVVALVFASKAHRAISASNGWVTGDGLVTAAKVIAWINIAMSVLMVGFFILALVLGLLGSTVTTETPNDFSNAVQLLSGVRDQPHAG